MAERGGRERERWQRDVGRETLAERRWQRDVAERRWQRDGGRETVAERRWQRQRDRGNLAELWRP